MFDFLYLISSSKNIYLFNYNSKPLTYIAKNSVRQERIEKYLGLENHYWNVKTAFTSFTTGRSTCLTCKGFSCTRAATSILCFGSTCSLNTVFFGWFACTDTYIFLDNSSSSTCRLTTLKEIDILLITFCRYKGVFHHII